VGEINQSVFSAAMMVRTPSFTLHEAGLLRQWNDAGGSRNDGAIVGGLGVRRERENCQDNQDKSVLH
jgi:hypothetical protein